MIAVSTWMSPLVTAVVSLFVGIFITLRARRRPTTVVIAGIAVASAFYNFFRTLFAWDPELLLIKVGWAGAILLIPLLAEFPDAILDDRWARPRTRRLAWVAAAWFLAQLHGDGMFLPTLEDMGGNRIALAGPWMPLYAGVMAVLLVRLGYRLVREWWSGADEMRRRRVEFILLGEVFYCLCALHDMLLRHQLFWVFPFPIVDWAALAFMFIVLYATMRYRLLDLDVVLSIGVFYSLLTVGTAVVYNGVETLLESLLERNLGMQAWWAALLPALVVAVSFGPLQKLIHWLIDRLFLPAGLRERELFRGPNFQYLVLDRRVAELKALRDDLDQVISRLEAPAPPPEGS
ncbi:MAG: hypothetical protein GX442_18430 [Candidatus Riflebacteria bacterium]|nr:hypothetical protein [Candidatus Riflebacteria bacterium]